MLLLPTGTFVRPSAAVLINAGQGLRLAGTQKHFSALLREMEGYSGERDIKGYSGEREMGCGMTCHFRGSDCRGREREVGEGERTDL